MGSGWGLKRLAFGRLCHRKASASHMARRSAARPCGALCQVRKHLPASGARTGRALQNGCALSHRQSNCLAFGRRAVAQAARPLAKRETESDQATGKPMLRTCQVRSSFAVRAPCAHHRKASAPPLARCFAKKRAASELLLHHPRASGLRASPATGTPPTNHSPTTKGAAVLPRPSCVPSACAFGVSTGTYSWLADADEPANSTTTL